jgi:Domain of unknown function (DUF4743)
MSLLERVRACHRWRPEAYRPWQVGSTLVGRVRHDLAERLRDFADVFEVTDESVALCSGLDGFADRSAAVDGVVRELVADGEVGRYRDEAYPVVPLWGSEPLLKMDRGAVPDFGVRGYGVHLNGLVEGPEGLRMWVGRRSLTKPTGAGKLDHLVAGGQPHGIGVLDNLIKEAAEEAALPEALARQAVAVGAVSYRCEREEGLRDDVLFCYDLVLPADFVPRNTDGEVDFFELWPMEKVVARIAETDDFKFNVAFVIVDFMVRRGLLGPDETDYMAIVEGLHLAP